jgi:hypothetical protein
MKALLKKYEQIALEGQISKPQGDLDLLTVNISDAHARIRTILSISD